MCKKGNYYISVYDKDDNNVMGFESIEDCANYFNTSSRVISSCLCNGTRIGCKYLLIKDIFDNDSVSKLRR